MTLETALPVPATVPMANTALPALIATERYLGSEQELEVAVNDNLGL